MITIAEVIEEFARKCEEGGRAYAFRALAEKYEGCIVAEGAPEAWSYKSDPWFDGKNWHDTHELTAVKSLAEWKSLGEAKPLYRAKEPTK
jgi:hypothetical protein